VYVELKEGMPELTLEALIDELRARAVSKETLPERLVVVDALPRSSGGKVAKQALREDIRRRLAQEQPDRPAGNTDGA
jgi:acyl-CoA synthetase